MTDNLSDTQVHKAARWLAAQKEAPHPVVPAIRNKFNLSAVDAIVAIREAQLIRGRAH